MTTLNQCRTERNYGIDLLRILSMLMVVILHILGQGGVLGSCEFLSDSYMTAWFLEIATYCAVNCYGLISGYVGYKAKYRYSNIVNLYLQVIFYTIGITAVFWLIMPETIQLSDIVKILFPFAFTNVYWYFTAYFCLFFFIPVLNLVVDKLEKRQLKILILSIIVLFSIMPTIFRRDMFFTGDGCSPLWLAILYIIGAYIRKYDVSKKYKSSKYIWMYVLCVVLTWGVKIGIEYVTLKVLGEAKGGNLLISYLSPTILLAAISLLLYFSKLRVNDILKKIVMFFSPLAFSVYLIHTAPLIWENVLLGLFRDYATVNPIVSVLLVLVTAIIIFLICSLIDLIRIKVFDFLNVRKMCEHIVNNIGVIVKKGLKEN